MNLKKCYICKKDKKLTNFYKDKTKKSGLSSKCKECSKELSKINRQNNKEKYLNYSKEYYKQNKDYFFIYNKEYRENNVSKYKKYKQENKDKINKYQKKRRDNDPLFKLKCYLRTRVYSILKENKDKSTEKLLGDSFGRVKKYIESTFTEGMTWENYGEWHVDHKIPLASANTKNEVEKLFHYTNLQALWATDNLSKGSKI